MPYQKAKDIFIQRKNSNGKFEEYPLIVSPNSVLVTDAANNLTMSLISSLQTSASVSASYAESASWAPPVPTVSASYSETASHALNVPDTASYALEALSASHAIVSDIATSSSYAESASWAPGSGTSDSASWASSSLQTQNSTQSIYANSSSWVSASVRITTADTASYVSASAIDGTPLSAISASHALVADVANAISFTPQTADSSSWASASLTSDTASYYAGSVSSASYAESASWAPGSGNSDSSSWASSSISSSYSVSASYAPSVSASYATTASHALSLMSGSDAQIRILAVSTGSFKGPLTAFGPVNQSTSTTGVTLGAEAGTGRAVFCDGDANNNWLIDQWLNVFRWYKPGIVYLALSTASLTIGSQGGSELNRLKVAGSTVIGNNYWGSAIAPSNGLLVEGKVAVGQTSATNSLDVAGNISCSVITASLLKGTASYAINVPDTSSYALEALSASYSPDQVSASYATSASVAKTASAVRYGPNDHILVETPFYVKGYKSISLSSSYQNVLTLNLASSHSVRVNTTLNGIYNNTGSAVCDSEYIVSRNGTSYTLINGYIVRENFLPETFQLSSRLYYDVNPNNIYVQYRLPSGTLNGVLNYEVRGLFDSVDQFIASASANPDVTYGTVWSSSAAASPFEFTTLAPMNVISDSMGAPFTDATANLTYDEIVNHCVSMSVSYPSRVEYVSDVISTSGSTVIPILKIDDDGSRPVVIIHHGVHGSEQDASQGLFRFLYDYLDPNATDPVFLSAKDRLTLIVVACVNPNGYQRYRRYSYTDVDINRNCIYGWEQTIDDYKGTSPNSAENGILRNWLYSGSYYPRAITSIDSHGWGYYGQWWIGYLVQQMWYTPNVEKSQRDNYVYYNKFLDDRLSSSFYSNNGLSVGLRGNLGMRSVESRGSLKPYVNNNGIEFSNPNHYRILVEHPQYFSGSATGSLGQSKAVNAITKYDSFHATLASAVDLRANMSESVGTYLDCPAMQPINSNSLFQDWNSTAARPNWTIYSRMILTQLSESAEVGSKFTRAEFPSMSFWPQPFSEAAYLTMSYNQRPYVVIFGGNGNVSSYNPLTVVEDLETGVQSTKDSTAIGKSAQVVWDETSTVWRIGGFYNSTYMEGIWSTTVNDIFTGSSIAWTPQASMSIGLQRHTAHYWVDPNTSNAYIVVVGGRNSSSYTDVIRKIRVDDASYTETTMSSVLTTPRAWHVSCVSASQLFVFGGYNGVTTYNGIQKIDLVNDSSSIVGSLPANRLQSALAIDEDNRDLVYIVDGGTGAATSTTSSIYTFNMSSSAISTYDYVVDNGGEENVSGSEDVARRSPVAVIYGDFMYVYGGEATGSIYTSTVHELDLNDAIMSNRASADASYGYLKISNHTTDQIFENTVPGDVFTAVVDIRRAGGSGSNGVVDPYIRLLWKTGPDSYHPLRKNLSGKFVPSSEWTKYSLPLIITSSLETEIQGPYIRSYVKGQAYDIRAFQVFKGNIGAMNRVVPQSGSGAVTASRTFTDPLISGEPGEKVMRLEPFFGANSQVDTDLVHFTLASGSQITAMTLHYSSSLSASLYPPQTLDYATWYYNNPTGEFTLRWIDDGGPQTQSFLTNCELNYAADRLEGYRRDSVSFRLQTTSGSNDVTASMWFKGKTETAYIAKTINATGFNTTGVGMLLYA